MALPKIKHKIETTTLPSNGKSVSYRPYTVKEEAILLTAGTSKDPKEMIAGVRQIINNCVFELDGDAADMSQIDMEYMFLKLMTASKSSTISLVFQNTKCPSIENSTEVDSAEFGKFRLCKYKSKIEIVVDDIEVQQLDDSLEEYVKYDATGFRYTSRGKQIMLDDEIGVLLRFPTLNDLTKLSHDDDEVVQLENKKILAKCAISAIFDKESVYDRKDITDEELESFFVDLPAPAKDEIMKFIDQSPVLKKEVDFACKRCGYSEKVTLVGLKDFLE